MKLKLFIILFLTLLLPIFHGCETGRYVITENGEMSISPSHAWNQDTIRSTFQIHVWFEVLLLSDLNSFTSSAKAFEPAYVYMNSLDHESIVLTIDRPCVIDQKTIPPDTDLIDLLFKDDYNFSVDGASIDISFHEEILNILQFEKGKTKFILTGKNSDNIPFEFEQEVVMDL